MAEEKIPECSVSFEREPIKIVDDPVNGIVEIAGIKFSYEMFHYLSNLANQGRCFKLLKNDTGSVVVKDIPVIEESEFRSGL